jgi:hypothetical protein
MEAETQAQEDIQKREDAAKQLILQTFFSQFHAMSNTIRSFPLPGHDNLKHKILDKLDDVLVWVKESANFLSFETPKPNPLSQVLPTNTELLKKEPEEPDAA